MEKPTIAEERLARTMAFWHGQKALYRRPSDGEIITVARLRSERYRWAEGAESYTESHWTEYVPAAREILGMR